VLTSETQVINADLRHLQCCADLRHWHRLVLFRTDFSAFVECKDTRVLLVADPFRWNIGIDQVIQHDLMMNIIGVFRVIRRVYTF
jgi:hypothetical protein